MPRRSCSTLAEEWLIEGTLAAEKYYRDKLQQGLPPDAKEATAAALAAQAKWTYSNPERGNCLKTVSESFPLLSQNNPWILGRLPQRL